MFSGTDILRYVSILEERWDTICGDRKTMFVFQWCADQMHGCCQPFVNVYLFIICGIMYQKYHIFGFLFLSNGKWGHRVLETRVYAELFLTLLTLPLCFSQSLFLTVCTHFWCFLVFLTASISVIPDHSLFAFNYLCHELIRTLYIVILLLLLKSALTMSKTQNYNSHIIQFCYFKWESSAISMMNGVL